VQRYRRWCELVVADVDAWMTREDKNAEEVFEVDELEVARAEREVRRAERHASELEAAGASDEGMTQADEAVRAARATLAAVSRAKSAGTSSRRDRILKPVLFDIACIDSGYVVATRVPTTHGMPLAYAGDWRGFTNYEPQ